jgi:hypothetical protein
MIGTVRQVMRRDRKIIRSYVSALRRETHGAAGQPVVIENRGGAGGTAGTVAVVRAAPDAAIRCCLTSRRVAYRRASGMRNKIRSKWTLGVFRAGGLPS